ncbi:HNH endonuclease [Aeoliella sp. ICT_H6.2]|uniref:HNH endonuclease n=1 Tax=Aeoliella straminimaris TaxID=2954799 RepID=A0A9X2FAQ3_9BACT|nr:HNH endonuclease [Aeoliella straminimaris]
MYKTKPLPDLSEQDAKRFWSRVAKTPDEVNDGCWAWLGAKNQEGYGLFKLSQTKQVFAHRVAYRLATGKPIPPGLGVLHSCHNRWCVRPGHLRAGTHQENMRDLVRTRPRGEQCSNAKLDVAQVAEIRRRYKLDGQTVQQIADELGVSIAAVRDAATGKTWSHVTGAVARKNPARASNTKLQPSDKPLILSLARQGWSHAKIAERFGVSRRAIGYVLSGQRWAGIQPPSGN